MKLKGSGSTKVAVDMTPMIDVVFQLMIFFMLTLKVSATEGNFDISMPIKGPSSSPEVKNVQDIKVKLEANADGTMSALYIGNRNLGTGPKAFAELNREIRQAIGKPGGLAAKEQEVELDPAYNLNFQDLVNAIDACTGKVQIDPNSQQKQVVRYVEKIKFAPPRKPQA